MNLCQLPACGHTYESMWSVVFILLAGQPVWPLFICHSVLWVKNFNVQHYAQPFFSPTMLIGAMYFSHVIPFQWPWPWLEVRMKKTLFASSFHTVFNGMGLDLVWWWSNLSCMSWDCCWLRFVRSMEMIAVLLTASKKRLDWHAFGHLLIKLVQIWYDVRYFWKSAFWHLPAWSWPWFKVMGMQDRKNCCASYLPKL